MKLTFTGEIVCNYKMYRCFNGNYKGLFDNISKYFIDSDYIFGNLEMALTSSKENVSNRAFNFVVYEDFAKYIKDIGWNVIYTANNHCYDNNLDGIKETIDILDKYSFYHTGTFKDNKKQLILNDIGIINYTYGINQSPFENINDYINLTYDYKKYNKDLQEINNLDIIREINDLKNHNCKLIIFELHAGHQYNISQSHSVEIMCNQLHEYGSDIVICNHEHVVHQSNKNKNIFYCLGNVNHYRGIIDEILQNCRYPCINYSIILHYDTECNIFTFNIVKTCLINNKPCVMNICDIHNINIMECKFIYEKFTRKKFPGIYNIYTL